jgi:hypothetical protein
MSLLASKSTMLSPAVVFASGTSPESRPIVAVSMEVDRGIAMSDLTRAAMAAFVFICFASCAFAAALVVLN